MPGRGRLLDYLNARRILTGIGDTPLVKVLLCLAQTLARDGCVRNPLQLYNELAHGVPPWTEAVGEQDGALCAAFFTVNSPTIRSLAAALAVSAAGIRLDRERAAYAIVLFVTPPRSASSCLSLATRAVRLFRGESRRERLLSCFSPGEVVSLLQNFEREPGERGKSHSRP